MPTPTTRSTRSLPQQRRGERSPSYAAIAGPPYRLVTLSGRGERSQIGASLSSCGSSAEVRPFLSLAPWTL